MLPDEYTTKSFRRILLLGVIIRKPLLVSSLYYAN
jgi:hypothetical protein